MPTISKMRKFLCDQYPDRIWWHQKVWKMPTNQVVAIYKKMTTKTTKENPKHTDPSYHQIDMFEYMATLTQNHTEVKI